MSLLLSLLTLASAVDWQVGDTLTHVNGDDRVVIASVVGLVQESPDNLVLGDTDGTIGPQADLETAGWTRLYPDARLSVSPPSFGSTVTVPATAHQRTVYGSVTLDGTLLLGAYIAFSIETAVGSGSYTEVWRQTLAATDVLATTRQFCTPVGPGLRYKFTRSGGLGTTETISAYNTTDL